MKILIVGGVAGGASAAARLRRLDEKAEIIILERGEYVSYANCGLPYYIGGKITNKDDLTLQTPKSLKQRMNIDVRIRHEAVAIDTEEKILEIHDLENDKYYTESYDKLVLSPGSAPIIPDIPGVYDPRVFTLRNIPDTYKIDEYIKYENPKRALIVGAGFIGLEMAENLSRAGLEVSITELSEHVIAAFDMDMAAEVQLYLRQKGINLFLKNAVQAIEPSANALRVILNDRHIDVDMIIMSVGVRPESELASAAGLSLGERGAIAVDEFMRTSDENIYAVGDAVQVTNFITNEIIYSPLAGAANKQGRIAADNIAGKSRKYKGSQSTAIFKFFDMAAGATGLNENLAKKAGFDYDKVYLSSSSHANYYPGAKAISIKTLFDKENKKILGAQIVGFDGVDKRLDVLATAIRAGMTADDLAELELAYAPPFSSAKDPVNMLGFMVQNLFEGIVEQYHWTQVPQLLRDGTIFLDVRTPMEYAAGHIENAVNIPLDELRERIGELDITKPLYIYCKSAFRSYLASRILVGNGFDVKHLAGGYRLYEILSAEQALNAERENVYSY